MKGRGEAGKRWQTGPRSPDPMAHVADASRLSVCVFVLVSFSCSARCVCKLTLLSPCHSFSSSPPSSSPSCPLSFKHSFFRFTFSPTSFSSRSLNLSTGCLSPSHSSSSHPFFSSLTLRSREVKPSITTHLSPTLPLSIPPSTSPCSHRFIHPSSHDSLIVRGGGMTEGGDGGERWRERKGEIKEKKETNQEKSCKFFFLKSTWMQLQAGFRTAFHRITTQQ